jgi:hypothetical protein
MHPWNNVNTTSTTIYAQIKINDNLLVTEVIKNTYAPAPFSTCSQNFREHFLSLTTPILIEDNGRFFSLVTYSLFSSDQPAGRIWLVIGLQMFVYNKNQENTLQYNI